MSDSLNSLSASAFQARPHRPRRSRRQRRGALPARLLSLLLLPLLLAGCGAVRVDEEFARVGAVAKEISGHQPAWPRDEAGEAAVRSETGRLLASPLSQDDAVRLALLNNAELQASFEELGVAKADFVQAGLPRNPGLDMLFQFPLYSGGERGTKIEAGGSFALSDLWQIPLRRKVAEAELEIATLEVAGKLLDVVRDARAAYGRLYYLRRAEAAAAESAEAGAALEEETRTLFQFGYGAPADVAQAGAESAEARLAHLEVRTEARAAKARLDRTLGLDPNRSGYLLAEAEPPLWRELPSSERAAERALARRLDLAVGKARLIAAARTVGVERYEVLSDIDLGAAYEKDVDATELLGPALSLRLPLFDQGRARVAKAGYVLREAAKTLKAMEAAAREEAETALGATELERARATALRDEIIPLREQAAAFFSRHASAMQARRIDMLAARRELVRSRLEYFRSMAALAQAQAELERALGGFPR